MQLKAKVQSNFILWLFICTNFTMSDIQGYIFFIYRSIDFANAIPDYADLILKPDYADMTCPNANVYQL